MTQHYSDSFPAPPQNLPTPVVETVNFLKRNALLIIGVGITVAFWVGLYAWFVYKPHYSSKAVVIIKDSAVTTRYVQPDQNYMSQTTSSSSSNPVLNSMSLLKSNMIGEALWKYLQDEHPEELKKLKIKKRKEWEAAFQDGSGFIKAKNLPGTDLISIQFSWTDGPFAKEGLDVVVKAFQDGSRDLNKAEEVSRTRYLTLQAKELADQLKQIRHQKSLYRSKVGTISLNREQDDLASSRLDLSNKLNQAEAQAKGKESLRQNYQRILRMTPAQAVDASAMGQNSTMARLQDELYRLKELYSVLHASLSDTNPKLREVRAQMAEVQANIQSEGNRTLGTSVLRHSPGAMAVADSTRSQAVGDMLRAEGESKDYRAQAQQIRKRLAEVNQQIRTYPGFAEEMSNLDQQENSLSAALDQLRQKVIESRIREDQTLSNVFIVDAPRLPEKPQFPTQIHLTILGLLLGLGTGAAVAFGREQLFSSGTSPYDNDDHDDDDHLPPSGGRRSSSTGWLDPIGGEGKSKASRPRVVPRIDGSLNMDDAAQIADESTTHSFFRAPQAAPAKKRRNRSQKAARIEKRTERHVRQSAAMNPELYDWAQSSIPSMYAMDETSLFPELASLQVEEQVQKNLLSSIGETFKRLNEQSLTAVVSFSRSGNKELAPSFSTESIQ